jgi:hypothetical protein
MGAAGLEDLTKGSEKEISSGDRYKWRCFDVYCEQADDDVDVDISIT